MCDTIVVEKFRTWFGLGLGYRDDIVYLNYISSTSFQRFHFVLQIILDIYGVINSKNVLI